MTPCGGCGFIATTSSSIGNSVGWLVGRLVSPQKFPTLWRPQFCPERLKFGMEVRCACVRCVFVFVPIS